MNTGIILRFLLFIVVFGVAVYVIHRARKSIDE
jgi:hypothetical protein